MIGEHFCPLGSQVWEHRLSRRTVLAASIATPVALVLNAHANGQTSSQDDDLRFIKDHEGVSVLLANDAVWRLRASAFGPETIFRLRTLRAGPKKGYELEVAHVGFGAKRRQRTHWYVFLRDMDGWKVRMRTNLWSKDEQDIAAANIPLSLLAVPPRHPTQPRHCLSNSPEFMFERTAEEISAGLVRACEGHVNASGRLRLELRSDGVWRITPVKGGRLLIAPYGFVLSELSLAWCDTVSEDAKQCAQALINNMFPLGAVGSQTDNGVSDPVFCASGTINPASLKVRCRGGSSFVTTLEHSPLNEAEPSPLSYVFIRHDWRDPRQGASEIRGPWQVSSKTGRNETLSAVQVPVATLRTTPDPRVPARVLVDFSGLAAPDPVLASRIGRIKVKGWQTREASSNGGERQVHVSAYFTKLSVAAGANATATSVRIPLLLQQTELAVEGAEFSELSFKSTRLLGLWAPTPKIDVNPLPPDESYLWLGDLPAPAKQPLARLDLTRARLQVHRSSDLLSVAFLFSDLYLEVAPRSVKMVTASSICRPRLREVETSNGQLKIQPERIDTRPTLVVEFPPQHVFEEALYKPAGADLPEVKISKDEPHFTVTLAELGDGASEAFGQQDPQRYSTVPGILSRELGKILNVNHRAAIRKKFAELKIAQEMTEPKRFEAFHREFQKRFEKRFELASWNELDFKDQAFYIGPYEMDPDVAALARELAVDQQKALSKDALDRTLDTAGQLALRLNDPTATIEESQTFLGRLAQQARRFFRENMGNSREPVGPGLALQRENAICAVLPDYAFFRAFYRDQQTESLMTNPGSTDELHPRDSTPEQIEYFAANNRGWLGAESPLKDVLKKRHEHFYAKYLNRLDGGDAIRASVRARFANPSRLAFRLNCAPGKSLAFSLETLTNWRQHELAVVPRAQAVSVYDGSGYPISHASSAASREKGSSHTTNGNNDPTDSSEDIAMLALLDIRPGRFVTSQERLSQVEASLARPPGPLETSIEIPARLILSPSQHALWRTPVATPRRLSNVAQVGGKRRQPARTVEGPTLLWGAELITANPQPAVRAVHSPDLRPGFVQRGLHHAAGEWARQTPQKSGAKPIRTAALCAPPRGPRAPWTIGIDEGDPTSSTLKDIIDALGAPPGPESVGMQPLGSSERSAECHAEIAENSNPHHTLVTYLRQRERALATYGDHGIFRSSLDAFDRHEIVLLSSAYGLPVRGKREVSGVLMPTRTSSQIEPPSLLRPIDLELGSALYRPRHLNLQELRLTALGGTLRHDTDFVPPTAARHLSLGALFDSFSIERWQHWVVLGRDVFAEVVYKGFLFPIGHRASLVKQTERVFLRAKREDGVQYGSVRAYLRQRMFIRIGQPDKAFPALGQPNMGRQFPASLIRLLTTVTPDLVDPTHDNKLVAGGGTAPAPSGRLFPLKPGLVFWPRTARIAGAEVRFEALVDSAFVRLPLIFVDNTATHDADVVKNLVEYYNTDIFSPDAGLDSSVQVSASDHLRTIDFAGQATSYCDELTPGSATHRTLFWTLKASGGIVMPAKQNQPTVSAATSWEGDNTLWDDPGLEGADQPPFYPSVQTARIRLDQVERMTAQSVVVGIARYDGYYIANGFSTPKDDPDKPADAPVRSPDPNNPLDIYLDIVNSVAFSMGNAGERSGGLYRPESTIVALSRMRGPLGGKSSFEGGALSTVVTDYDETVPTEPNSLAAAVPTPENTQLGRQKAYKSFFENAVQDPSKALDTKLLGIVKLKDLVDHFVDLKPASEGLPQLREVVAYGMGKAADAEEATRNYVILPLNALVADLQVRWNDLDQRIRAESERLGSKLTITSIFPEIDHGLKDLRAALGVSAQAEGANFYSSLAEVYECGRRLGDALERASANPLERTFLAVAGELGGKLEQLQQVPNGLGKVLDQRVGLLVDGAPFTAQLAMMLQQDDFTFARYMLLPAAFSFDSVGQHRDAIVESLKYELDQCGLDKVPRGCAATFIKQGLLPKLEQIDTVAAAAAAEDEKWIGAMADALEPLFRITQTLAAVRSGENVSALAAVGSDLLTHLGPDLTGRIVTVSSLHDLLESLNEGIDEIVKTISRLDSDNTMVTPLLSSTTEVALPKDWSAPSNGFPFLSGPYLDHQIYQVADTARLLLAKVQDDAARTRLRGLSSEAFAKAQAFRRAAERLAYARGALEVELKAGGIERISYQRVTTVFGHVRDLLALVNGTLDILLPENVPSLFSQQRALFDELTRNVGKALNSAITVQKRSLELARRWIEVWRVLEDATQGDVASKVEKAVSASIDQFGAAIKLTNETPEMWVGWIKLAPTLRPSLFLGLPVVKGDDPLLVLTDEAVKQITAWRLASLSVKSQMSANASPIAHQIVILLAEFYAATIVPARASVHAVLKETLPDLARSLLVTPRESRIYTDTNFTPSKDDPTLETDQLFWDLVSLQELKTSDPGRFLEDTGRLRYATDFLGWWRDGTATPLIILKQAREVSVGLARARLLSLIDFSSLREKIDEQVKRLIPLSSELSYGFQADIGPDAKTATRGVFAPQSGCRLSVKSTTRIDFLDQTASFKSVGEIGPFNIHILGKEFDALTLKFDGAHFRSTGGPIKCDVDYRDFEIGRDLKFLDQLQSFLTPKQGSGFYLVPLSRGIGIEAGYGLNIGTISIGTVAFFNVSLNAAARIPFDGRPATFVASLSRRDAPFTIACAPYGGSGFFAIEASAAGIVGYEASFEFGGTAAFKYGPLEGQGRLMTGVYIRRGRQSTVAVTFYAGGTATLWVFSFGASLYVTAESTPDSTAIIGNATFTFSFSIGFADYDYRVNVRREIEWQPNSGGDRKQSASNRNSPDGLNAAARLLKPIRVAPADCPQLRIDSWCQSEHWGRHCEHMDLGLDIDLKDFA